MAIGTDAEILGSPSKKRESNGKVGRKKINRELVMRNMKLKDNFGLPTYTDGQLAKMAGCTKRTIRNIRSELIEAGELESDESIKRSMGLVEADFDAECERANGYSFSSWMQTRFSGSEKNAWKTTFNFCSLVWEKLWNKCSLLEMADRTSQLADLNAIAFVNAFQEDNERMRGRLKKVRFIFRFLGRKDVCDRHLTMSDSKHPRPKRKVPEITIIDFGKKWTQIENLVLKYLSESPKFNKKHGIEAITLLRFKLCSQMRTGNIKREKECWGLRKGTESKSYIFMESPDRFQCHVFAKQGEEWDIMWLPKDVRERMYQHLETIENGDNIWSFSSSLLLKHFRRASKEVIGRELILHDLRKIGPTWLYCMGISAEVIAFLNVGWNDLNTMFDHYLNAKKLLRGTFRLEYQKNIPAWFKDGLEEYMGFEAIIESEAFKEFLETRT